MFLALREMRRAQVRFALLILAVSLLLFLILFQQALQNSLITGFVGALERQSAPVLVYTTDAQRTPFGSVISPDLERKVSAAPGVAEAAAIGVSSFTVRVDGGAESSASLVGYEKQDLGGPDGLSQGRLPERRGEAVGSDQDFVLDQRVTVVPAGEESAVTLQVVGLAENAELLVTPTLFVPYASYQAAVRAGNPDAQLVLPSLVGLRPDPGVTPEQLVVSVNQVSDDADALTRSQAADESPGVAQVRQSFQIIFLLYGLVVPLITGLFFLIITFQKAGSLTLLRAVGARSGTLIRSLLVQVLVVVGGGIVLGTALYAPLSRLTLGTLALDFDWGTVAFWAALLMGLGLLSALVAARRVLAIDPIEATTGGERR
jgi:putative ABC transport system permease protein